MPSNPRARLRRYWRTAHRWAGLTVGWLLALVGLVGAVLIVAQPLDRWCNPQLFKAQPAAERSASASPASLESIRAGLADAFGGQAGFTMRLPRAPGETLRVSVRGEPWSGTVYLNPATGQEQGRRGEYEGVVNVLFKFHSALLLQDTGKAILAGLSLFYLALLVSGLVLWWPRNWPPGLKIELHRGWFRALFDAHRTGGAVLGLLMAVTVATGAYLAWRPLAQFVTAASGGQVVAPPKIPAAGPRPDSIATVDDLVSRARARFPDDAVTYVQLPAERNRPVRVRVRLADDPHPNGLTSIWFDPGSGAVLAVDRWNEVDLGTRAFSVVYPLHTGELGGPALETLIFGAGLSLGLLGFSGLWIWWRRRGRG